ncbi:MAG TPA: hypothetical protein VM778_07440 [Gemmatimonadota bacterium]|nr:hypothetical protein [Gemmatimonadota bacterium]
MTGSAVTAAARRRALATALWLAAATLLGGLDLPASGYAAFRFAPFGMVAGLLGILYVFVLYHRGVIRSFPGWPNVLLLVYWTAATATAFRVLLPPPGLVQVALALLAAFGAGVIVTRVDRVHAAVWVAFVAVALAVLKFALVPAFEARSSLPDWGPFQFGQTADSLRDFFVAYAPQRPAAQGLHFVSLAGWALALWTQWGGPGRGFPEREPYDTPPGLAPGGTDRSLPERGSARPERLPPGGPAAAG